jgi:glycosyltransferase involved in cell wall biosynthesis
LKLETENLNLLFGMPEQTARGGINACEPPFLRELEKRGARVHEEIYSFANDEKTSLLRRIRQVVKTAFKFRRLLQNEKFDLLHLNTAFDLGAVLRDSFTLFWIKNQKTKIFLKFHGTDAGLLRNTNFVIRFLIRYLLKRADAVGVLSSEEKRNLTDFGAPEGKIFVIKNAVAKVLQESFPQVENSGEEPFRLLFVSRLIPTKGLLETIRAGARLHDNGFNLILNVLGEGETRAAAEDLVNSLNKAEIIHFHGHVAEEKVREFYCRSDLLVFPTFHQEGFQMVVFNALAFGLPIVTTRIRAAADYLREGENCLFCEPKNAESVAKKILEIIENPSLREKMSENNRKLADSFTAEKIAPEYLEIYRKIIAN